MTTRRIGKTVYCDLEDRFCYLGKWETIRDGEDMWWEDNALLGDDNFWVMVDRLRKGNWRMI